MDARLLKKSYFNKFIVELSKKNKIIAPVKKDILRFSEVNDPEQISFSGHPLFSAKKYFKKPKQTVFSYDKAGIKEEINNEEFILFGIRLCDINALLKLDKLFLDEFDDKEYKLSRESITLIGINCETAPKDTCFC